MVGEREMMRALIDHEWEVSICHDGDIGRRYYWKAFTTGKCQETQHHIRTYSSYITYASLKLSWKLFAKLNGFKKWKFI